eukprot:gene9837-biopygen19759
MPEASPRHCCIWPCRGEPGNSSDLGAGDYKTGGTAATTMVGWAKVWLTLEVWVRLTPGGGHGHVHGHGLDHGRLVGAEPSQGGAVNVLNSCLRCRTLENNGGMKPTTVLHFNSHFHRVQ